MSSIPSDAATKVKKIDLAVEAEALRLAEMAAKRVKHRATQVRRGFIQRARDAQDTPPLARAIRGGRGGEVRLKVYLAILWIGSGGDHDVQFPASSFARLLALEEPYGNGARRVNDALKWLARERLIKLAHRPGREPIATLLSDDGSGEPYVVPGSAVRSAGGAVRTSNIYLRLPATFWTNGWAAHLSASAIAMLLVLMDRAQSKAADDIWISPHTLASNYVFSDDTRSRGIAELEATGLVLVSRRPVSEDFGHRRVRNAYSINPAMLDKPCTTDFAAGLADLANLLGGRREAWRVATKRHVEGTANEPAVSTTSSPAAV
jgi:hypothetical protein